MPVLKIKLFESYYQIIKSFKKLFWLVKQKKLILASDYYLYEILSLLNQLPDSPLWF
jgi:hypothetical protein